jgi:hypothetical protein
MGLLGPRDGRSGRRGRRLRNYVNVPISYTSLLLLHGTQGILRILQTFNEYRRNETYERHRSRDNFVIVVEDLEPTDTFSKIAFRLQPYRYAIRVELTCWTP